MNARRKFNAGRVEMYRFFKRAGSRRGRCNMKGIWSTLQWRKA